MSQVPEEHHNANENGEHHRNVSDESKASLDADLEPSAAKDRAEDERLAILIQECSFFQTRFYTASLLRDSCTYLIHRDESRLPVFQDVLEHVTYSWDYHNKHAQEVL